MVNQSAFGKLSHILTFPFKHENWQVKLLIASLLCFGSSIIPVVPIIFLLGYLARLVSETLESGEKEIVSRNGLIGKLFTDGVRLLGATILFWLPLVVIYLVSAIFWIIPAIISEASYAGEASSGFAIFMVLAVTTQVLMSCVAVVFSIIVGFVQPVYLAHMVAKDDFSAIFKIKEWWMIFKHNAAEFLLIFVFMIGLSTAYSTLLFFMVFSLIFCCLTPFVQAIGQAYLSLVYAGLIAYAYQYAAAKVKTPDKLSVKEEKSVPVKELKPEPASNQEVNEAKSSTETAIPVEAQPTLMSTETLAAAIAPDDLTKIEGIGPKTSAVLNEVGIFTYMELSRMDGESLREVLETAGYARLARKPETWAHQAQLAAKGDWDALKTFQDTI